MPPADQVRTRRVQFDESAAETHEVVPAVAGETIKVKELHLYSAGTTEVTIQSGTTPLAAYPLLVGDQINLHMIEGSDRHFETVDNEALNILLGSAIRVTGFLVYEQS